MIHHNNQEEHLSIHVPIDQRQAHSIHCRPKMGDGVFVNPYDKEGYGVNGVLRDVLQACHMSQHRCLYHVRGLHVHHQDYRKANNAWCLAAALRNARLGKSQGCTYRMVEHVVMVACF